MSARAGALLLAAALGAGAASARSPEIDYMLHCRGCHLADGAGSPDVPALRGFVGNFLRVPGGREFLVRVPGSSTAPLSDADLAALLNWMIAQFGPPGITASFEAFTAEEVARTRRPPLTDVAAVRARLLRAIERRAP